MKSLKSPILIVILMAAINLYTSQLYAANRFVVKEKVIIDSKSGVVWLKDANIMKAYASKKEAFTFIKKMNSQNFGGYDNWTLPSIDEFEESFDCRRIKPGYDGMKKYYLSQYRKIGFKNVHAGNYMSSSYDDIGRAGSRLYFDVNPTCCTGSPSITDIGYFWPVAHMKK